MGKRLTDKEKKQIVSYHIENGNSLRATARYFKISDQTVRRIVKEMSHFTQKVAEKKEENSKDILKELGKDLPELHGVCKDIIKALKERVEDGTATVSQLTTSYGTLIDKILILSGLDDKGVENTKKYTLDSLLIADTFQKVRRSVLGNKHMEYIIEGGRGSAKSSYISLQMIEILKNNSDMHCLIVRQVADTLRDSVYAQMKWAINELGLSHEFDFRVSPLEITYKATGQKIYFRGADDPLKIKSIKVAFGYIGVLWFEEIDQFKGENSVRSIEQSAIRGGDTAYIFKSFNPPKTRSNWVHKYKEIPKENRLVHHSTYKKVPPEWLGKIFIDEAEFLKQVNPKAYEHEYLGISNGTGGNVFDNVTIREITDEEIKGFDRIYMGVDWGYYPDPYHYSKVYFNASSRKLYVLDEYRCNKKSNKETFDYLIENKGIALDDEIIADSAEKKSVADYVGYGMLRCVEAEKGAGSVNYSMKWLQSLNEIIIDNKRTPYTAKEFLNYEYETTKDGEIISGYPDKDNHSVDAIRYALNRIWRRRGE